MPQSNAITIIIPSFRDARILDTIASVRAFDDAGVTRLLIIDGGSPVDLLDRIRAVLMPEDVLVSEPDRGIFDALNKGLERVDTEFMGWLGSDDVFTGDVPASEVLVRLAKADLFIASLAFFRGNRIRRITHSWMSRHNLVYIGLHNPHYATFGRTSLLQAARFEVGDPVADIRYFLRIFDHRPRVETTAKVATLAGEGGFSNSSYVNILKLNGHVFDAYRKHANPVSAAVAVTAKLGYKALMRLYFKARPVRWSSRFPAAARFVRDEGQPAKAVG